MNTIGLNGSLYMGSQALNADQLALQTTGNNITNVNTPGYARQRVNFSSNVSEGTSGELDMGVSVSSVEGIRSNLLDGLVQQSLGDQGFADNQASLTSTVEAALGEQFSSTSSSTSTVSAGSGPVQSALTNFFGAMQNLASDPSDATARQVVVSDAATLSSAISSAYTRVQQTQAAIATDASSVTTQINQLSQGIASLNQQITQSQAVSGTTPNELIDARDADVETLSGLVNVTSTPESDGTVTIALADDPSVVLVSGQDGAGAGTTQSLSASYNASGVPPLTVSGSTSGVLGAGVPSSGTLGSDLDVANNVIGSPGADGDTGILGSLDDLANQIISQVNTQNEAGYDLNGNPGGAIFSGTGAADMAVAANVASDPSLIAAGNGTGTLDGSNALAMANLQNSSSIIPAFQTMVSNLGQTVSDAQSSQSVQDQVTQQLENQRNSVSGVSIDEEMTNLIQFQQSYDASAHFITTISNLYSTLVNMTPTS